MIKKCFFLKSHKSIGLFIITMLFINASSVEAEITSPKKTLSLEESFLKAAQNNKELIAAKYNLPIAKADIQIAGTLPNPQFSFLYGFGPAFQIIIAGNPQQFGWQQTIQTAGKRTKQVNLARANYKLTELQIESLLLDIRNRVRRAYAELAAAEAYCELTESQRKIALELATICKKRYDAGKSPLSEVLQAQLGVMQFDLQRRQARTRLEQATASLSLLIGETPSAPEVIDADDNGIFRLSAMHTDLVPQPEKPLPPLESLLPFGLNQRPDFKMAIQQAFADRQALSLAKSQRIPNLSVDCGYQFTTFRRIQPYQLALGPVPNSPGCYLNFSAQAPVFYQQQGETKLAKETWLQDFDQLDQLNGQIASDIVTAYESLNVSRANIYKFQKELLPAAAQVSKLARRRYEVGKGDLSSAILAKQQYQQILASYFDSVVSYQNAWADIEKAMGVPLKL